MQTNRRAKSQAAYHWSDIKSVFYHQLLMADIVSPSCPPGTRVRAHGWITQLRIHDKLLTMVVSDLTATIECILFRKTKTGIDGQHQIRAGNFIRFLGFKEQQSYRNQKLHKVVIRRYEVIDDSNQQLRIAMKFIQINRESLRTLRKMTDLKNFFQPRLKNVVFWKTKPTISKHLTTLSLRIMIVRYLYDSFMENPDCKKLLVCSSIIMKNPLIKKIFQSKKIDFPKAQEMVKGACEQLVRHRLLETHKQNLYMAYEFTYRSLEQLAFEAIELKSDKGANAGQIFDHIEHQLFKDISSITSTQNIDNQYGLELVFNILKKLQNNRKIFRNAKGQIFKLT